MKKNETYDEGSQRRWRATHKVEKTCPGPACSTVFTPENRAQVYCSISCRTRATHAREKLNGARKITSGDPRICHTCKEPFLPRSKYSGNAKYCSHACRVEGIRTQQKNWKNANPDSQAIYNRARAHEMGGGDTVRQRLYNRYPDLPTRCESSTCSVTDVRILEAAHKPGFERKGDRLRVMKYYERHMFWMLCPNCHTYLDTKLKTPDKLGLKL